MSKAERPRTAPRRHAGRAGVGLALAATTAVGATGPAAHAQAATPTAPAAALHGATARAIASAVTPAAVPQMTYQVQPGDTVSHIALRTGSSVDAIVRANNLDALALIRVGQMLKIPSASAVASASSGPAPSTSTAGTGRHSVRGGETLSGIAKSYGTTVGAIVSANGLKSAHLIRIGQQLTIPGATARPATAAPVSTPVTTPVSTPVPARTHRVVAGDTVSVIAKKYGTTVAAIVAANNLGPNALIRIGQTLQVGGTATVVPVSAPVASVPAAPAPSAGTYTVRAGDTVSGLARTWGTTVPAVIEANRLSGAGLIYVGQTLKVPAGASAPTAAAPATGQLVPNTFLGRTYPEATVSAANANKATLLARGVPSRAQMQATVVQVARQMGVDPALAQAHAYQESGFNHTSVSPANAIGTMQVIPSSGEWASSLVGRKLDLLDPNDNVVAGVAIIRQLVKTFPGDLDSAIASYYQGAGSVKRNGMFADTERYVASVKAHMARF
ncbi:LysM peptidoglycan-binding domain-containing protein [Georgenia yuyongxinii]|nr:LysM peptidoglycan-binding domain-containing protein [Georgenia yuyongxinii]